MNNLSFIFNLLYIIKKVNIHQINFFFPGILPPPGAVAPVPPPSVSSPDRSRANKDGGGPQQLPVFFDPSDAPQVAEVLKNSKSSVIQVF